MKKQLDSQGAVQMPAADPPGSALSVTGGEIPFSRRLYIRA